MGHKELITTLLVEHLGPIEAVENEAELIRRIVAVDYPNGRNIKAALSGMGISDRQRKPYQDALILGRIAGLDGDDLVEYINENVVIYPGNGMNSNSPCHLRGIRSSLYHKKLKVYLDKVGNDIINDANLMKPLTILDIGRLSVKHKLNFKALTQWLEESRVIPTGTHTKMIERGIKATVVYEAALGGGI